MHQVTLRLTPQLTPNEPVLHCTFQLLHQQAHWNVAVTHGRQFCHLHCEYPSHCVHGYLRCLCSSRQEQQEPRLPKALSLSPLARYLPMSAVVPFLPCQRLLSQQLLNQLQSHPLQQLWRKLMMRSLRPCRCWPGGSWLAGKALCPTTRYSTDKEKALPFGMNQGKLMIIPSFPWA